MIGVETVDLIIVPDFVLEIYFFDQQFNESYQIVLS